MSTEFDAYINTLKIHFLRLKQLSQSLRIYSRSFKLSHSSILMKVSVKAYMKDLFFTSNIQSIIENRNPFEYRYMIGHPWSI